MMTSISQRVAGLFVHRSAGLLLILALILPLRIWRATDEGSLWIDELYTIQLIHHPWGQLLPRLARDSDPPAYFFAEKLARAVVRRTGLEPGVLCGRSLNLGIWILMVAGTWVLARSLFGPGLGALVTWCIAASSQLGQAAQDMRAYGLAAPCLLMCFLSVEWLYQNRLRAGPGLERKRKVVLILLAACSVTALWAHLFSTIAISYLSVYWFLLAWRSGFKKGDCLPWVGIVLMASLLTFVPWIERIPGQISYYKGLNLGWHTAPTLTNLILVFFYWFPLGQIETPSFTANPLLAFVGISSLIVPLAAFGFSRSEPRERVAVGDELGRIAIPGLVLAVAFTLTLWAMAALSIAPTFHGPRYPMLAVGPWIVGLCALSGLAAKRARGHAMWHAVIPMVPFLIASVLGAIKSVEVWHSVHGIPSRVLARVEAKGLRDEPVYVFPSELIPFLHRTFAGHEVRSVDELDGESDTPPGTTLVDLTFWKQVCRPGDLRLAYQLQHASKDGEVEARDVTNGRYSQALVYQVLAPSIGGKLPRLSARDREPPPEIPPGVQNLVAAEDISFQPGWATLEFDDQLRAFCWALDEHSTISFPKGLPPGRYRVHALLQRHAQPNAEEEMQFHLGGTEEVHREVLERGQHHVEWTVVVPAQIAHPWLEFRHPTWVPREGLPGSDDSRSLAFMFRAAWIEPVP